MILSRNSSKVPLEIPVFDFLLKIPSELQREYTLSSYENSTVVTTNTFGDSDFVRICLKIIQQFL